MLSLPVLLSADLDSTIFDKLLNMSANNIVKQLEKDEYKFTFSGKTPIRKAFMLTDSKGRYLLEQAERGYDIIDIIFESGANSVTSDPNAHRQQTKTDRLLSELLSRITGLSRPLVLLWLGTCDFTKLDYPFVILRADAEGPIISDNFKVILEKIRSANATAEILFLECPMYSIEMWNEI